MSNALVVSVLSFELFTAILSLLLFQLGDFVYLYFNKIFKLLVDCVRFIKLNRRVNLLSVLQISNHFSRRNINNRDLRTNFKLRI